MPLFKSAALVILTVTLSLSGCAIFRANDLPDVGILPGPAGNAKKPTVGYAFTSFVDFVGDRKPVHENMRSNQESEFSNALCESGYFVSVEKGSGKDIQITAQLLETGNPAALVGAFITGFSLMTIPSWTTIGFEMTCKVTTTEGITREYKLNDSATMVNWLPMLFVFPFKPLSEIEDLRKNFYKTLIVKMQADGILPKPGQPAKTSRTMFLLESPAV